MTDVVRIPLTPEANQIEAAMTHLPDMTPDRARRTLKEIYATFVDMRPNSGYPPDLSIKMIQMLETIREFQDENAHAPSQAELAAMFGISRQMVMKRLLSLKRKGYITIRSGHRGIVVRKDF